MLNHLNPKIKVSIHRNGKVESMCLLIWWMDNTVSLLWNEKTYSCPKDFKMLKNCSWNLAAFTQNRFWNPFHLHRSALETFLGVVIMGYWRDKLLGWKLLGAEFWATWYSLDIRDDTGIPIDWPPRQKGSRRKSKSVFPQYQWVVGQAGGNTRAMWLYRLHQTLGPPVFLFCCQSQISSCQFLTPWHLTNKWKDQTLSASQRCVWPVTPARIGAVQGAASYSPLRCSSHRGQGCFTLSPAFTPPLTTHAASLHHICILFHSNSIPPFHPDTFWSREFLLEAPQHWLYLPRGEWGGTRPVRPQKGWCSNDTSFSRTGYGGATSCQSFLSSQHRD